MAEQLNGPIEYLAWIDVETTGLRPDLNHLLQVAGLVTTIAGEVIPGTEFDYVIRYPAAGRSFPSVETLMTEANDFVRQMHSATGLWDQLPLGTPLVDVDQLILERLAMVAPTAGSIRLAGNSVRLDLNFAEKHLPRTYAHLHYRSVDVSAMAFVFAETGLVDGYFEKQKTHNALGDIRESLAEYRWLMSQVQPTGSK